MKSIMLSTTETKEMTFEEIQKQFRNLVLERIRTWLPTYEYDDLIQIANFGLWKAYKKYDITKGVLFITLAHVCISGQLSRHHRDNGNRIKEVSLYEVFKKGSNGDNDTTREDITSDGINFTDNVIENTYLEELLHTLEETERSILLDYYIKDITQIEIAKRLNRNQVYVNRSIAKSLNKLRAIC